MLVVNVLALSIFAPWFRHVIGKKISMAASQSNLKRVTLEVTEYF
jgi:hypothetical protein